MYIYIYIHTYIHIHVCIYKYIYRGWRNTIGNLIEFARLEQNLSPASFFWYMLERTEGYSFIEFEIPYALESERPLRKRTAHKPRSDLNIVHEHPCLQT